MALVTGSGGVVAAGHPAVAEAGVAILADGGNAVDAAVGAMFASFHAEPLLASVAGGGFLLARVDGEPAVWDFFAAAPGLPSDAAYRPPDGAFWAAEVDFGSATQVFHIGPGSVAVPGGLAGLCAAQAEAGRLPLSRVLGPAMRICAEGSDVGANGSFAIRLLEPIVRSTARFEGYLVKPDGALIGEGDRYHNPELGDFYEAVARTGAATLTTGPLADLLVHTVRDAGGGLTHEDLAAYEVRRSVPLEVTVDGARAWVPGAPSSGGMLLAYKLALLQEGPAVAPGSRDEVLLLRAVMAEALRARAEIIGAETPSDAHAVALLASVREGRARVRELLARGTLGLPREPSDRLGSTTHVSAIDGEGNAAAVTMSNGECSGLVLPEQGVFLNNFMGEADLHPLGFHRVSPGTRLASSMSPMIVEHEDGAVTALGSGGSNRIRTALLQVLRNLVVHALPAEDAVRADRVHYEDDVLYLEAASTLSEVAPGLEREGARVAVFHGRNMFFGGAHLAARDADGGVRGVGDDRRGGAARVLTPT